MDPLLCIVKHENSSVQSTEKYTYPHQLLLGLPIASHYCLTDSIKHLKKVTHNGWSLFVMYRNIVSICPHTQTKYGTDFIYVNSLPEVSGIDREFVFRKLVNVRIVISIYSGKSPWG